MYWKFGKEIMPKPETIEEKKSRTGDICHRNVLGVPDEKVVEFFTYSDPTTETLRDLSEFTICVGGKTRPLKLADLIPEENHTENNA
jgi:hypothetical protein